MDNQEVEKKPGSEVSPTPDASQKPVSSPTPPTEKDSSSWKFTDGEETGRQPNKPESEPVSVQWSASEFVEHKKSLGWYVILALAAVVVAVIVLFLTKDKISTGVIILAAILFGVYAGRHPRTLNYQLDESGLTIADKFYPYDILKSFAVVDEGSMMSIVLFPLKRFMPQIPIYCSLGDEKKVIDVLSTRLPIEEHRDAIDNFMRRIRF